MRRGQKTQMASAPMTPEQLQQLTDLQEYFGMTRAEVLRRLVRKTHRQLTDQGKLVGLRQARAQKTLDSLSLVDDEQDMV